MICKVSLFSRGYQWNRFRIKDSDLREKLLNYKWLKYRILKVNGQRLNPPIDVVSRVTKRLEIRLPRDIARMLDINPGDELEIDIVELI